jgi:hypothetical protein
VYIWLSGCDPHPSSGTRQTPYCYDWTNLSFEFLQARLLLATATRASNARQVLGGLVKHLEVVRDDGSGQGWMLLHLVELTVAGVGIDNGFVDPSMCVWHSELSEAGPGALLWFTDALSAALLSGSCRVCQGSRRDGTG